MVKQAMATILILAVLIGTGCTRRSANMGTAPTGGEVSPPASSDETSRQ